MTGRPHWAYDIQGREGCAEVALPELLFTHTSKLTSYTKVYVCALLITKTAKTKNLYELEECSRSSKFTLTQQDTK